MTSSAPTLLLIEDFPADRELYRRYLSADAECAYRLLEADTASEGLELCRTEAIDAILLDYLLPDADGLQFLESLQAQSNGSTPPVVMVTGEGDETVAVQAIKLGAEDYLTKRRLTPELLQVTMRSAIENARLRLQLQESHDRFQVSIENMLDCFGIYSAIRDRTGRIIDFRIDYLNAAALESNQMTLADIGRGLCDLLPAHREIGLFSEYCRVIETGESLVKEELRYSDDFGTHVLTHAYDVHVSRLGDGFVASWRDVTARKQAEIKRQQQLERERIFNQMMQQIRRLLDPWEILNTAVAEVRQFLNTDRALVYRFNPDFSGRIIVESVGEGWLPTVNTQIEDTCFIETQGEHFRRGRASTVEDIATASLTGCHTRLLERFQVRANLVVPILQGEDLWGLLVLHQCSHPRQWQPAEVALIQQLAAQVGIAVQQSELYQQVQQKQQFIQQVSDAAPGLLYIYDLIEQRNIYSNRGIVEVLGYTSEEVQAMGEAVLPQLFHPDDFAQVPARIAQLQIAQPGENFESEFRLRHANGEWRWFCARETVYRRNAEGVAYQILGVAQEITDRKRLEAELHQRIIELQAQQHRLQRLIETAPIGIGIGSARGEVKVINDEMLRLHGCTREEFEQQGMNWRDFIAPELAEHSDRAMEQLRQEGILPPEERELMRRDGSRMPIWSSVTQWVESPDEHVAFAVDLTRRKQVERALQASQQRYQQLAEAMPQMVWTADADGLVNYWNQQWYEYSGLSEAESIGLASASVIHPEDRDRTLEQWGQSVANGNPFEIEYRVRRWDGDYRWFMSRGIPTRGSHGKVTGWIGTITNIDELKRSQTEREQLLDQLAKEQQRLQQSEERLRLGIQVAGVAIAHFDYATNQVTLSPEAAALYGFPADPLIITRDQIHATFHPEEQDRLMETIRQVLDPSGDGWFAREHRVVWTNGEVRWLNVRKQVFFDRSGAIPQPDYAILAAIDITDKKATEATLRESEAHLRYTVELNPQVPWTADPNGKITRFSDRWLQLTGMTREQASGDGWVQAPHPDDLPAMAAAWTHSIQTGEPYDIEHRIKLADGSYRWMRSRAFPRRSEQGEIVQWYGTTEDIDDRKQIEFEREELLQREQSARAEAEAANRSKDDFVSLVAHELRSPLNAILGWAQLLQSRQLDAATTARALETIARNTQAQAQLVEDLLDVSRIVRGALQLTVEPVDLVGVIEEAIEAVRPTAEAKRLTLNAQLNRVPALSGDPNRLRQVVLNLLTNAIKFTPEGGRIGVVLKQADAQLHIQVSDTGKGINSDFLPYVFDRFCQDQQNPIAKQGLGLGLAIVKHLVEGHGGTVTVESRGEGLGATFTVMLPLLQSV